ncbi:DUF6518 family protein [Humibacter ginsenosidimutans]|uniref:Uncharacterized protein n=1 Tax=Humibacter ginsenosidimutans TaxID=2599293 RepID=A0A5B8M8K6_9MICO|nr:DUF6518 family protein [Humibacter ginsenosidimutans]QDZ15975.1 hypothetical protein FPZ11_15420 [Humibacter ginsenosidimutans]
MTPEPAAAHQTRSGRVVGWLPRAIVVVVASFAIGCLESWAQGVLPDAVRPLSNSASGWTLVTALLVFWSRATPRIAAVLGALSFVLLVVGYSAMSTARGFAYSPVTWGLIGVVVGPFVGVAAAWLHSRGYRAALGGGLLAGIGIGEGVYGLTSIADTTGVAYWIAVIVLGIALLGSLVYRRVRGVGPVVLLIGATVATAIVLVVVMRLV